MIKYFIWHAATCQMVNEFTAHANDFLGQKKLKQIYLYRTKGTYLGYMGDYEKIT